MTTASPFWCRLVAMSVAVRRNLLCFVTGALLALAVVLLMREGDDGTPNARAVTNPPAATATTSTTPRSVRLFRQEHPARRRHPTATSSGAPTATGTTAATGQPTAGTARIAPSGTTKRRSTPTKTTPADDVALPTDDPAATDPSADTGSGDATGGQTTTPAPTDSSATTGTGDQTASDATGNSGVTIPNPATPDTSVGGSG